MSSSKQLKAAWYVGLAYALWGFFPIYWKALAGISALELISHRIVWSFVLLAAMIARSDDFAVLWQALRSPRIVGIYSVAAIAIATNWLIFVWAVGISQIVQISLGYFINPLLSVVLGMVVFHERLRTLQWVSVALAALGVVYLTVSVGSVPWIALSLATTFAIYSLMKKVAPLTPVQGLAFETGILFVPAALYLIAQATTGRGSVHAVRAASQSLDARVRPCDHTAAPDVCRGRTAHPALAGRDAAVTSTRHSKSRLA